MGNIDYNHASSNWTTAYGITANSISQSTIVQDMTSSFATKDYVDEKIKETHKVPDVPVTTKTVLVEKCNKIYVKHYKDGFFQYERSLIPSIVDVRLYDNTVVVMFADKTKTSAVLDAEDTYNVEQGISICITKKLLGEEGHTIYNKLITRALKVIEKQKKAAEAEAKKKEADKQARELKRAKVQRRKAKKREESINIQAEAIKRVFASIIGHKSTEV